MLVDCCSPYTSFPIDVQVVCIASALERDPRFSFHGLICASREGGIALRNRLIKNCSIVANRLLRFLATDPNSIICNYSKPLSTSSFRHLDLPRELDSNRFSEIVSALKKHVSDFNFLTT